MSLPGAPDPAKLVVGVLLKEKALFPSVTTALEEKFGPIDGISSWLPFDYTDYYEMELGAPLLRRMFSFTIPIDPGTLARIKHKTNAVEQTFAADGRRRVNIDPGYLLPAQFVLATGKNYSHRIYLGEGIYADLTLIYEHKGFRSLPWTYPDYREARLQDFLRQVRKKYMDDKKRAADVP